MNIVIPSSGRNTDFSKEERESFRRGEWRAECAMIEVRGCNPNQPLIYRGPGFLFQDEYQQISFRLYAQLGDSHDYNVETQYSLLKLKSGEYISDTYLFEMTALDFAGRLWRSEKFLLHSHLHGNDNTDLIEGRFKKISCSAPLLPIHQKIKDDPLRGPNCGANLIVFDDFKFPCNIGVDITEEVNSEQRRRHLSLSAWQFEAAGIDWELRKHENFVEIRLDALFNKLPKNFIDRAKDALFWVLGHPIHPSVLLESNSEGHTCTLYSQRRPLPSARLHPPLTISSFAEIPFENIEVTPYRDMVDAYVRWTLCHDRPRAVWANLNAVYESSGAEFIHAQNLTLSVVIESFTSNEFASLGQPDDAFIKIVEEAMESITNQDSWDIDSKNRLKNSLGSLKRARIGDRLRILENRKAVDAESAKKWSRIRNATAHDYHGTSADQNSLADGIDSMTVLFYQLLFHAMGYHGLFTDYRKVGWPTRTYPSDISQS